MIREIYIKAVMKAFRRLLKEGYTYSAAALAYNTLLALVPLLTVVFYFITIFPVFTRLIFIARDYIIANFLPGSSEIIQKYLFEFILHAYQLPSMGILFLLVTALLLIFMVEHNLNRILHPSNVRKKMTWRILYWGIVIFGPLIIGTVVIVSTYMVTLTGVGDSPLLSLLPLVINSLSFSVLYIVISNNKIEWQDGLFGGIVAALFLDSARAAFGYYLLKFPSYELIYGTLAIIPAFLIWIYISWLIVLFGALLAASKFELRNSR